jgi:hypothetical protein
MKIPLMPRSVCFPLAFSADTHRQMIVGQQKTLKREINGFLPVISSFGVEAILHCSQGLSQAIC